MSNLIDHAKLELELIGEEPATIDWYLTVVAAFASFGHSGGSAGATIPVIMRLLQFENLSPLTDNPAEWNKVSDEMRSTASLLASSQGLWQNTRLSEAFSHNAGKTYYLLSEGGNDTNPYPQHKSVDHKK